jgi:hypothetical protein
VRIFSLVSSESDARCALLMLATLRHFGGALAHAPVHVFVCPWKGAGGEGDAGRPACAAVRHVEDTLAESGLSATVTPLSAIEDVPRYPLAAKVTACAEAERVLMDGASVRDGLRMGDGAEERTLTWMVAQTLVVAPPILLDLSSRDSRSRSRAAFRVVHISNVGSPAGEPLDDYWRYVYEAAGLDDASFSIESLVDRRSLRPYFNTHLFSVDAGLGLMAEWKTLFDSLVDDAAFQTGPCADERRKVFLHQAVLCALLVKRLGRDEITELPPSYSYPLHFHADVPSEHRAEHLGRLVCPVYEGRFSFEETLRDVTLKEPLQSWFARWSSQN